MHKQGPQSVQLTLKFKKGLGLESQLQSLLVSDLSHLKMETNTVAVANK